MYSENQRRLILLVTLVDFCARTVITSRLSECILTIYCERKTNRNFKSSARPPTKNLFSHSFNMRIVKFYLINIYITEISALYFHKYSKDDFL